MIKDTIKTASPYFPDIDDILHDMRQVIESGILMNGSYTKAVEQEICKNWNVDYAVTLNSCTSALQIAMSFLGVIGRKVLVSTNTYVATANAVLFSGGMPIFCDIAKDGLNPGHKEFEDQLTSDTVGVIYTHIAGIIDPAFDSVQDLCRQKGLFLIEDCSHAHGAKIKNDFVGTRNQAGCFSFYPTKIITSGNGGILTTNDLRMAEYAKSVRFHGQSERIYYFDKPGNDWFMNEVTAVLALHQIRNLEAFIEHRRRIADFYKKATRFLKQIVFFKEGEGRSVYYKLPVTVNCMETLVKLAKFLTERYGIESEPLYYPPCHMQPVFRNYPNFVHTNCPNAEDMLSREFCLPLHASYTEEQAEAFVIGLDEFFEEHVE